MVGMKPEEKMDVDWDRRTGNDKSTGKGDGNVIEHWNTGKKSINLQEE